jgi:tRNA threonylcarbamoyladenosine biosynthesis protein TsaB
VKLLGWDTSSKAGALVALEWDEGIKPRAYPGATTGWSGVKLVCEWQLGVDLTHSERLLWGIDRTLQAARWKLPEVDVLAVGVGPGSFTGIRVGVTTARTLAHSLKKPLVGVSSLAALARPAATWLALEKEPALVVATTDAAKGELFALWGSARSVLEFTGRETRGVDERVLSPDELVRALKKKLAVSKKARWLAVGEGRLRYPDAWATLPRAREINVRAPGLDHVQGRFLGMVAWEAWQAGLGRDALSVLPKYLRESDATLKLKAGLLAAAPVKEPRS